MPVVQVAPLSVLYWVVTVPAPLAEKVSVTGPACQALSAPETVVVGACVLMLTMRVLASSWLPSRSVER